MEHPFFTAAATARSGALRWLAISEKLLGEHDLLGSKSFAARAHNSDLTLSCAEEILAIIDTLLGAERRFVNNQLDWYGVLHLTPLQGRDAGLVSDQFRRLSFLLNPQTNRFPFADQAFRLINDAYFILSNPSRKWLYDRELGFYSQPPPPPPKQLLPDPLSAPMPALSHNFIFVGGGGVAQQLVHDGESGNIGGSHSAQVHQVHVQPQVEPVVGGPTRQPQNFMGFSSGHNFVFGSGSRATSGYETVSNHEQESYSNFGVGGNVVSAPETTQELFNSIQKQSLHNFSNVSDETIHNVNVSENFETVEGKEDVEVVDVAKEEQDEDVVDDEDDAEEKEEEKEEVEEENEEEEEEEEKEERADTPVVGDGLTFWTACPYCYYMYEYPLEYVDCALKCQNCKRAFQAVVISSPPPIVEGQESYFCCWGFLPFGLSMEEWKKHNAGASGWAPFTPMFSSTQMGNNVKEGVGGARGSAPRVNVDDSEVYVVISDSSESDEDKQGVTAKYEKNKAKNVKGKKAIETPGRRAKKAHAFGTPGRRAKKERAGKGVAANIQCGVVSPKGVELPKKMTSELNKTGLAANSGKQPGCTKLDLNVELSVETEEPAIRTKQSGRGEEDNIEGNGLFEGLEEYLSSLPILNGVGDDKVVKAAS